MTTDGPSHPIRRAPSFSCRLGDATNTTARREESISSTATSPESSSSADTIPTVVRSSSSESRRLAGIFIIFLTPIVSSPVLSLVSTITPLTALSIFFLGRTFLVLALLHPTETSDVPRPATILTDRLPVRSSRCERHIILRPPRCTYLRYVSMFCLKVKPIIFKAVTEIPMNMTKVNGVSSRHGKRFCVNFQKQQHVYIVRRESDSFPRNLFPSR
ncbi:hypothetical protein OUZ56_010431 [Daphnia magna]|uniref:Uncharacterized protein n=1 Tax=Daphnia magna TaxID=35525 RepID=A0ABR0AIM3_9CRUS|nr:hypothetical protein OUZ56_010431 [Daphnia magna]